MSTGSRVEQSRRECLLKELLRECQRDSNWAAIRTHLSSSLVQLASRQQNTVKAAKARLEKGVKSAGATENIQKTAERAIKTRNLHEEEDQWQE